MMVTTSSAATARPQGDLPEQTSSPGKSVSCELAHQDFAGKVMSLTTLDTPATVTEVRRPTALLFEYAIRAKESAPEL